MRLLVLSTWCPLPQVNGSTLRAAHLLRALTDEHEVDLIAFSSPGAPDPASLAELRTRCRQVTVVERGAFDIVPGSRGTFWSSTPKSLGATHDPALRQLVQERRRAAAVAIGLQLPAARYLDTRMGPAIFEESEPRQIETLYRDAATGLPRLRRGLTWWKQARYLRALARSVDAVTVVSELERESLGRIGVDVAAVYVLPNGADEHDLIRVRAAPEPARLVYSGSVTYGPNLEAVRWCLAEIMPIVRRTVPAAVLWVTGDVGDVAIDRLPNREWAHFTGRLPDVRPTVAESAVAVVPLLAGGGTRLKVLEALALGTPVVSTVKGAEGLALRHGQHLMLADAPDTFAAAVVDVLQTPALAAALSEGGRAVVAQQYTWGTIGQHFLEIVDRVAARSRPG